MNSKKSAGSVLSQVPEGKTHLRIRNISDHVEVFPSTVPAQADLVLKPQEETVRPGAWANNPYLRAMIQGEDSALTVEWVDEFAMPRPLVTPDQASDDIRPEIPYDRQYVMQICTMTNADLALEMIKVQVTSPGGEDIDIRFMKGRMYRVLQTVRWLEPQLQNRAAIKAAVEKRLHEIRAM